jgi:hypothetical protein
MKAVATRKLEETSWLAQTIVDKMEVESNKRIIEKVSRFTRIDLMREGW